MKKVVCISLAMVFLFTCTMVSFADVELLPSGVVSWSDVGEDALNLANTYLNVLKSKSGKEFFKNATDIPTAWLQTLSDGSWALSPVDDYYYFLKDGVLQVGDKSGGSGGKDVTAPEDFYIPSDTVVNYIEQQNTFNTPKGKDLFKQSYRTDTYIRSNYSDSSDNSAYVTLWNNPDKNEPFEDLYLYPFFLTSDGVMSYTDYQYHFYYKTGYDANSDLGLFVDSYKYTDGLGWVLQDYSGCKLELFERSNKPFTISVCPPNYSVDIAYLSTFQTASDYSNFKRSNLNIKYLVGNSSSVGSDAVVYTDFDNSDTHKVARGFFNKKYSLNSDTVKDLGFICSHSLIERTYKDIDTSKIPSNQVINITGDTIYDYSITNPDTGASTTINEYVTNNYYYPEVPSTSEPSGGGVGGNVTVGGDITVGGQVGVDINVSVPDININVNQGSGAGGNETVVNPDDILDGSSVDLDKYYDDAVSQASGVRSFLSEFFDFLPAEIIGLLGMLIAVAIVCRLFGR